MRSNRASRIWSDSRCARFGRALRGCLLAALLLSGAGFPPAHAQVSASLTGAITDPSGAPIPAATVTTKDMERGAVRNTVTDDAGRYLVLALPVGQYEVRATKAGFQEGIRRHV